MENKTETTVLTDYLSVVQSPLYAKGFYAPYNPDDLVRKFGGNSGLDTYQKMKTDDAVKSALFVKKSAVISSGWSIKPYAETPEAIMQAEEVTNNLLNAYDGNFDTSLMEILSALEYGFSVMEKVYYNDAGRLVLKCLKSRPAHSFEFHTDEHGNLLQDGFKQWTQTKGCISLPMDKFLVYVYGREFDNWYGNSDLRSAYRSWYSKDYAIKSWNIYLERNGNPLAVARYGKNTSSEERSTMQDIVDNLSVKTSILLPDDAKIEFISDSKQATADYNAAINTHNAMIMRSILVPKHLGFDEANSGSYALGKVNFDVFFLVINRIRSEIETLINEQLIRQMVTLLNPNAKEFPVFAFNPLTEDDKNERLKAIVEAIKGGVITADESIEKAAREILDLPEQVPGQEPTKKEEPNDEGETPEEAEDEMDDEGDEPNKKEMRHYKMKRHPNKYEKKVNFAFINKTLVDNVDKGLEDVKAQLKKIRDDYTSQIVGKKVAENKDVATADKIEFRYVKELGMLIEGILREGYDNGLTNAKGQHKKANLAKPVSGQGLVKSKAILWIKSQARIITGDISNQLQGKVKKILMDGVAKGLTVYDIVDKIETAFEPYVAVPGVEGSVAEGLKLYTDINTAVAKSFRTGNDEFNSQLEADGLIEAYEYSAILDDNTTEECEELDGLIFGVNNPVWDDINPPIWWNCRSIRVPIFQGEEWEEDSVPSIVYTSEQIF